MRGWALLPERVLRHVPGHLPPSPPPEITTYTQIYKAPKNRENECEALILDIIFAVIAQLLPGYG